MNRRSFLLGALAAPAVILTPGLLMRVRPLSRPLLTWDAAQGPDSVGIVLMRGPTLISLAVHGDRNEFLDVEAAFMDGRKEWSRLRVAKATLKHGEPHLSVPYLQVREMPDGTLTLEAME